MGIKVKRLRWAGNYAITTVSMYHVEHTTEGRFKAGSPTFKWYPSKEFNNKKAATEACQRHWTEQVIDLIEVEDEL